MITPESLAKSGKENAHQTALFQWAALNQRNAPELRWLFAIPNGATYGDDARSRAIRGGRMKAEGLRDGVVDIMLPVSRPHNFGVPTSWVYHGLFIEMKRPAERLKRDPTGPWDTGGVSDNQKEFMDFATAQGYKCVVCYSWLEAANEIKLYLTGSGLQ